MTIHISFIISLALIPSLRNNAKINSLFHHRSSSIITNNLSEIRQGKIYVQQDFLNYDEIIRLRNDIKQLRDHKPTPFQRSGLSNRVEGDQNIFDQSDRLTCTITPDLWKGEQRYSDMRSLIEEKLEALKIELELSTARPGSTEPEKYNLAEMYYSISPVGSSLPRHQDERHEETKGEKAWSEETRRSISWLIYLNTDWSDSYGGEFRAYYRNCCRTVQCGCHEGNIQVGWLRKDLERDSQSDDEFEPVFLDCWIKTLSDTYIEDYIVDENDDQQHDNLKWKPLSALYCLKSHEPFIQEREYISPSFGVNSPSWPKESNLNPSDFIKALSFQLCNDSLRQRFFGLEQIDDKDIKVVDVIPLDGTLVLFDSVVIPHEVLKVKSGERLSIAGWFHEAICPFPDWYGT
jgi:hypothetical protein